MKNKLNFCLTYTINFMLYMIDTYRERIDEHFNITISEKPYNFKGELVKQDYDTCYASECWEKI